jgi:ribosomal protein S12 methylthiotransferase accessory factor
MKSRAGVYAFETAREEGRTDLMKGEQSSSLTPENLDQILQFAPNFTVYALPSDVLCLYSEDRKFLLHGTLYCAIAALIAESGKSTRDLVAVLEQYFPQEQIHEALKRLLDRRYVVPKPGSTNGAAAAYWASLGLPLDTAEKNLEQYRVRVQAIGVQGEAELSAALSELGVRIVKRSPNLTVALVSDYLEEPLAELNRRHLSDERPWILVQPSGIFPLVGPVLSPGKGACWVCLADRMKRNREIRGMLNRSEARQLIASPLRQHSVGQSGIQLAAIEIAKAIATGFRTDLSSHIVSLDLTGSNVVKHYVAARPQCSVCGSAELRDPGRAPTPIELKSGGRPVMTSGGYRTMSSRATVARHRKHVSPLTGVVSRLERIEVDLPLNTSYYAKHNFSAPANTVHELRNALDGASFGKGSTAEQSEASALMESIERYSGVFQGDEIRLTRRLKDFPAGEAIPPNSVLLFSEAQYQRSMSSEMSDDPDDEPISPFLFDNETEMEWSPVWSLRDKCFRYLPTSQLYFYYSGPVAFHADSNGCAAGNTLEEAIVQGFLELVERDAYAIWWYNRLQRPAVDLARFDDSYIRDLQSQLTETGRDLWVLDITSDLGIPSFVAVTHWVEDGREYIEFGSGSHFDARIAMLRTLTELNQFMSIELMSGGARLQGSLDGVTPLRLADYPYLSPSGKPAAETGDPDFGRLETHEQVMACVKIAEREGLDFLVLDQTRPDIQVPVVRVIVPGLRHFYRRFAPGRLYDVPVKLGWRKKPIPEEELNPIFPHT